MIQSRITAKGQTTVPKAVREVLGLQPGDKVAYLISDGEVRMRALQPISSLRGIVEYDGPAITLEKMDEAIAQGAIASAGSHGALDDGA